MQIQPRFALLSLCTLAFATACGGGDSSAPPAVATVDVAAPGSDLIVGQTAQLSATPRDAKGNALSGRTPSWTTSSAAIATVSSSGLVTGVTPGTVTISATVDGKIGSATITVVPPPVATVAVTLAASTVQAGQTTQATADTRDGAGNVLSGRTVTWSSSDPTIA